MTTTKTKPPATTRYSDARRLIRDGDNALFRNAGLIQDTGLGPWTHVGKCYWYGDTLMLAEVREWVGGRTVTLSSQVTRFPGAIDIFRPKCSARVAAKSAEFMCRFAGQEYSYANIWWLGLSRLPILRLLSGWNPDTTDLTPTPFGAPKHCSQAVVMAERLAGKAAEPVYFPCPRKGDRWITPDDIGFSADYTLIAERLVQG